MEVTTIGHAGLLIRAGSTTIACDPWFEPAFFASWYVFPRNDQLSNQLMNEVTSAKYLYISHIHGDHLDIPFLTKRMGKAATVLLPDFPSQELEATLRKIGFTKFIHTKNGEEFSIDGAKIAIHVETSITDGPGGDSAIVVSDSTGRIVNQNDCRTHNVEALAAHGPVDVHYLQFSGAIWYPMVYELPAEELQDLVRLKVESQFARCFKYVESLASTYVAPSAGPPCFLDDDLYQFNVITGKEPSIFPDQTEFLKRLDENKLAKGLMNIPGTNVTINNGRVSVTHPCSDQELSEIFTNKDAYLRKYQSDWADWLASEKASWGNPDLDVLHTLQLWWEPLMAMSPTLCSLIGGNCLIRTDNSDYFLDFSAHQVREFNGEPYAFRFEIPVNVFESVVAMRAVDFSNSLFLSCRFKAWREGEFNEYLYNFFKSLNPDRMKRTEAEARTKIAPVELSDEIERDGFIFERYCPHRNADLDVFGECEGSTLTCTLHGWKFDLNTGKCLTAENRPLRVRKSNG